MVITAAGLISAVLRAVGEEVFFRGLIAGVVIRRWAFGVGNLIQALVFLLPHLLLLVVDLALWPLLPAQFVAGCILGWLRYQSGSVGSPAMAHAGANLAAAVLS